ncbi:transglutaminase family protein [Amycolatopsis jiangsuensis]|uniref:Transglutaminase-like putative cysteine protease n=1 Tax=Amycolatopsis jiangsuensis TaxID=1181879 RepID=A0A840J425_9PSEU|nr:transglutaminase domain-containing protein [Amycolatopsis jiangsuensis]MBB4688375.1 transglutaminase-like putative cysteine protease [Amycolatopsis jiangsuensis]
MSPQWTRRSATALVLLATGLAGLLFTPVFGAGALALPIVVVLVVCFAVAELCTRASALAPWRPVLALVVGLLALGVLEFGFTAQLAGGLLDGVTQSWQLTLQSTWPARPDPELLLFVPLAVLFASVLGVELLRRPAVALVPGLAVAGLSQAYVALSGAVATAAGLAYVLVAGALLLVTRGQGSRPVLLVPMVVLAVVVSVGLTAFDQGTQPPAALHHEAAPLPPLRVDDPLDQIAERLTHPATPVFSYSGATQVDRWRMAVLDDFDGVTWRAEDGYRRLGASLGEAAQHARITVPASTDGPWLPSQPEPASVTGIAPLVDPGTGVLLLPGRSGPVSYDLGWREPRVPGALVDAGIDPDAVTGGLGQVPAGVADLAGKATGGLRPSFRSALQLERYLSENYRLANGPALPTGSGWAQLRTFLFGTKAGTSEQFAAAYVALARITGIPARLAVGFRAPGATSGTVHNGDVFAWPEVAVAGAGWVPLDPARTAANGSGQAAGRLAQVTAQARAALPPPPQLHDPDVPKDDTAAAEDGATGSWLPIALLWLLVGLAGVLVLLVLAIPLLRKVRTARRRRRTGADGVVAAWREARDLLRARGVAVPPGATVRDLAALIPSTVDSSVREGLEWLARQVDVALWSGAATDGAAVDQAWTAVQAIHKGLSGAPLRVRLRAAFEIGSLRPVPQPR